LATPKACLTHYSNHKQRLPMEKIVNAACTLLTFVTFFAVLGAWELDEAVRFIWAAMFAGAFGYIFFRTSKKSEN
ncbi:hypothetical protein, partial [Glutamicibacter ardleyensis]|uniref:hypothetical protein n=1 Tax=Glutamicibacter ardleyensis TaxID=225894 RepID=UPI003FD34978